MQQVKFSEEASAELFVNKIWENWSAQRVKV